MRNLRKGETVLILEDIAATPFFFEIFDIVLMQIFVELYRAGATAELAY